MGRTIIHPPAVGDSCAFCWGSGKPFGAGPTPSVVSVVFSGIQKGAAWSVADGEPKNGAFRLSQISPCSFNQGDIFSSVFLGWDSSSTGLSSIRAGVGHFSVNVSEKCLLVFENGLINPADRFFGGSAIITL